MIPLPRAHEIATEPFVHPCVRRQSVPDLWLRGGVVYSYAYQARDDLLFEVIVAIQPVPGNLHPRQVVIACNARYDEEDTLMLSSIRRDDFGIEDVGDCARLVEVEVYPGIRAGSVGRIADAVGVGPQIVLQTKLAALRVVVTEDAVLRVIVLLEPGGNLTPVLYLRALVIEGNNCAGGDEEDDEDDCLEDFPRQQAEAQAGQQE